MSSRTHSVSFLSLERRPRETGQLTMCNSHRRTGQHALESQNQSPAETRAGRHLLHHRNHHGRCHHPRCRGERFQRHARSNLVVPVELRGANSLYVVNPLSKPDISLKTNKDSPPPTAIMVACLASFRALFTKSTGTPHQRRLSDEATKVDSSASSRWLLVFNQAFRKPSIFTRSSSKGSRSDRSGPIGLRSVPPITHENHRTSISAGKKPWQHHSEPSYGSEEYILPSDRVHVKQEINMA